MDRYRSPLWLGAPGSLGGNLQTIWPALFAQVGGAPPAWQRERWPTPDGDFIDVDRLEPTSTDATTLVTQSVPLLVLFHGLEGSSASHYARAFGAWARSQGWRCAIPHFRGCSGEINLAPRSYHSGDFQEIDWILRRMRAGHVDPVLAVGVSLGGNALLKWAGESGSTARDVAQAVAAVCSPLDLTAAGRALSRGFNRQVYTRMFLRTLKPKALAKLAQHPGLFDARRLLAAQDLYSYDNAYTAPVHGFKDTDDYWARASAKPVLPDIRVPALALNALNDPFIPAHSLPRPEEVGRWVTLWQPRHGGHVGFPAGRWPGHVMSLPEQVGSWLKAQL